MRSHSSSANTARIACTAPVLVAGLLLSGCSVARAPRSARANAPALSGDLPMSARGGSNPNAPYLVLDHGARLIKRPVALDINAAAPCAAADLGLFESGARMNGEKRSVRLNLVNHSTAPCRLGGYPSISLLRPDGTLVGGIEIEKVSPSRLEATMALDAGEHRAKKPAESATPSPYVLIAPAGEAVFEVGWTSSRAGETCSQIGSIAVAAPGTTQSFVVRRPLTVCPGKVLVTAVSEGSQL